MKKIEASITCHNMFGIQFETKTSEEKLVAKIIKGIVMNSFPDNQDYIISKAAGAFLQSYSDDFIMVEFWKDAGADAFIDYINQEIPKRIKNYF